jgi:F420H(2)-dependent quinone reductase
VTQTQASDPTDVTSHAALPCATLLAQPALRSLAAPTALVPKHESAPDPSPRHDHALERRSYSTLVSVHGGLPVLVLTTRGRKTGKSRSTPVGYLRYGKAFAVIASNAGSDRVPAWWLNLQADPHAEILVDRTHRRVIARRATDSEDAALWDKFATLNPGYGEYRQLTHRRLPVVILEPHQQGSD